MSDVPQELSGPDLSLGVELEEMPEATSLLGHAHGEAVVLVRSAGALFATGAACTHYGGPLAEGLVCGGTLRCPWHHAAFDLKSGAAVRAPAFAPVAAYRVEEKEGRVFVRERLSVPAPAPRAAGGPESVLVVGGGAAAFAACHALRAEGFAGALTIVSAEPTGPVDRPNLSKDYLAGKAPEEWIPLALPDGVVLKSGVRAVSLDAGARSVTADSGETLSADRILLATGAEPIRLEVPGSGLPHVFTLRTLADSKAIIAAAEKAGSAVVIGAGFIGLEAAASLRERGLSVHVVSPAAPLARVLGEEVGGWLRSLHEEHGVVFHVGGGVAAIDEEAVVLEDGTRLPADLVVTGIGVRPRTELAQKAGLAVDRGILVDGRLETSAKGIFAAGDVARYEDPRFGGAIRVEHWVVAERMGKAAALAMLGRDAVFEAVPFFWSAHDDVTLAYVGHAEKWDRIDTHGALAARDFTLAYRLGGKTLAVVTCGRDRTSLQAERDFEREDDAALAEYGVTR